MTDFEEKDYTLVFCRRKSPTGNEILLGMKKRGFGCGRFNGFGGKVEQGESNEEAAKRELLEESSIESLELKRLGYIVFKMLDIRKIMKVHIYETWNYVGEPVESDEMRPKWFNEADIPYENMWLDDKYWFPLMLQSKSFCGRFEFEDEETITDYSLKEY